jgi:hypothetical protein
VYKCISRQDSYKGLLSSLATTFAQKYTNIYIYIHYLRDIVLSEVVVVVIVWWLDLQLLTKYVPVAITGTWVQDFVFSILSIKCASTTYMNPFDMLRCEINAFMNYAQFS